MKSIKARFTREKQKQPYLSDLINFTHAITKQNFTKRIISENLHRLVDTKDYKHLKASDKKDLINQLVFLSKPTSGQ